MHTVLNRGKRNLYLTVSLLMAAPVWAANTSSISCSPSPAAPGTQISCVLALSLQAGVSADAASIGVTITPNGGAPATTSVSITDGTGQGFASKTTGTNFASAAWGSGLDPQLTGNATLGTIKFNIPAGATGGQTYTVSYNSGQPTAQCCGFPGGVAVSPALTAGAPQTVTVLGVLSIATPATGATLPAATVGAAYTQNITATGGTAPLTYTLSGLPAAFSIDSTGKISGTPTVAATYTNSVGVTVKDSGSPQQQANATYSLTVNAAPSIGPPSGTTLPTGTRNTAYAGQTFTVTGGTGPYTWTVTSANLPAGLNLTANNPTSTASLAGTPTASASAITVTVKVQDSNGASATGNYTLTINGPLGINGSNTSLPTATVGAGYSTTVTASGGTSPYTWSVTGLPAGLSINNSGVISGTPSVSGSFANVVVTVTDQVSASVNKTYTLTVNPALLISGSNTALPTGTAGSPYSTTIAATGGDTNYTWTTTTLPAGLSIGLHTGVISGTPGAASNGSVTVTVTDGNLVSNSKTYTLVINQPLTISAPATLPGATVNTAYSQQVTAIGGTGPYTWSAPALPAGLSISGTGATATISGSPSAPGGPVTVTVTVTDSALAVATKDYSFTVNALPVVGGPGSLPVATVSAGYTSGSTITLTGGTAPITWTATGLPAGLSINSSGVITGTPTTNSGSPFTVVVTAKDANLASSTQNFSLVVNPALVITTASLPAATRNAGYAPPVLTATGGDTNYTWTATGLPAGLTLSTGGAITGTPTASGVSSVTFTVKDGNQVTVNKVIALTVNAALTITGPASPLPGATVNTAYSAAIVIAGGTAPFQWSAPSLPAGLSINGSGVIGGTPTTVGGPSNFTVTVTDVNGASANQAYSLTVNPGPTVTGPASPLPVATVNWPYTGATATVTGGSGTITWSATGLPAGLTIGSATGVIGGTPTGNAGSLTVIVTATDSNGATGTKTLSLTVYPALVINSPATLPVGTPNVAYPATTVTATGGLAPYTWSATGLPSPLTINGTTGVISGTPANNTGSPYTVVVTATDSNQVKSTKTYSLAVNPPLSISGPASLPAASVNTGYTPVQIVATGGSGVYTWSATGLPPGLTISSTTGNISGAPTNNNASPYTVVVTVTDSSSTVVNKTYSLIVTALPLSFNTFSLPLAVLNAPYSTPVNAQGGVGNYTFTATGLPPGLTISNSGTISGTATTTTGSPFTVTVTVTDGNGASVTTTFPLIVSGVLTVAAPTTAALPVGTVGSTYPPTTIAAGGGKPPYTWSATGLPAGLTIGIANGIVTGVPTTAGGPFNVTATVTDALGAKASKSYTLTVNAAISVASPASLPTGTVGVAYTATTVTATGGSGTYSWAASGLPPGLTINATTGAITGTPTATTGNPYPVVVTATDSTGASAAASYSVTINPPVTNLPTISSVSNAAGGQAQIAPNMYVAIYGVNFAAAVNDWTKSIVGGVLPTKLDGISVNIGGTAAYVYYVSPTQINVYTGNVGLGPVQVTVTTPVGTSAPFTVTAQQYSPALFPWPGNQPVATHTDFTLAAKAGTFAGTTTVPAKPGETIVVWGTGFGPTTPAVPVGTATPTTGTFVTSSQISALLNGAPATVFNNVGALAGGFAGLFQIGVTVPAGTLNGDYTLTLTVNGVTTPVTTLTVHN